MRQLYFCAMTLLEVKNVSKQLGGVKIVNDTSFEQLALQKVAIAGQSGAGKSTLLKIISGHTQPDSGMALLNGHRVIGPEEKLLAGHKQIAYLSQHYELLNNYYVKDLICYQMQIDREAAMHLFELCRIRHLLERKTGQLSGGEKQRIALCGLLVKSPRLLILDEPFSNLDLIHSDTLKSVLEDITEQLQITCLLASHDPLDTLSWADMILVMQEGTLIQQGTPEEIYHHPLNEYVAGLFGKYQVFSPDKKRFLGIGTSSQDYIFRPEDFVLGRNLSDAVQGIIGKIRFCGAYYEVEVSINNWKLTVRSLDDQWNIGEEILIKKK